MKNPYEYYRLHEDALLASYAPPIGGGVLRRPRVSSGKLGLLVRRLKRRLRKRTR